MSRVSAAAGYGSIRRFNDAFRKTYGRSPRELRKAGEESELSGRTATLTVRLPYRRPFSWAAILDFFAVRATPGVEAVRGDAYFRTIRSNDEDHGVVEIRPDRREGYLSLTLHSVDTNALFETVQKAREVFDLDAPISEIRTTLGEDRLLKKMLRKHPGVRVPGAWDGFEITIRAILGQQVSVKAATTLAGRIAERYGTRLELPGINIESGLRRLFPTAAQLMRARLQNIGLVRSRAATIQRVAAAVQGGDLHFDVAQDPLEFREALLKIKGVGEWTAQYVAMRALKNPDAFPGSLRPGTDQGLRVSRARDAERINNEGRGVAALAGLCRHALVELFTRLRRIDRCITATLRHLSATCYWLATRRRFACSDFRRDPCAANRSPTGYIRRNRLPRRASS